MNKPLEGKVALITGGSTGIGLAAAREMVAQGARVFVTGRRQAELDAAVAELGPSASGIRADASVLADLDAVYAKIARQAGRLDVLFANAGGGDMLPLGAITEAHFDRIFQSYTLSMIPDWQGAIREAARKLAPGGRLDIVDFGQQNGLPRVWRALLFAWLAKFDVTPRATLRNVVEQVAAEQGLEADFLALRLGYAWTARLSRAG